MVCIPCHAASRIHSCVRSIISISIWNRIKHGKKIRNEANQPKKKMEIGGDDETGAVRSRTSDYYMVFYAHGRRKVFDPSASLCFAACLRYVLLCATVHDGCALVLASSRWFSRPIRIQYIRADGTWNGRVDANKLREREQRAESSKKWSKLCRFDLQSIHFDGGIDRKKKEEKTMPLMKGQHITSPITGFWRFFSCLHCIVEHIFVERQKG